jgi:hypothetical protein
MRVGCALGEHQHLVLTRRFVQRCRQRLADRLTRRQDA